MSIIERILIGIVSLFGWRIFANNVIPGTVQTHPGIVNRALGADLAHRHRLVGHDVAPTGVADRPLGVVDDVGKTGELVAVCLLGVVPKTLVMTAADAIDAGDEVVAAADGKVQSLPTDPGTYQLVGCALTSTVADGDEVEVAHCLPRPVVVS